MRADGQAVERVQRECLAAAVPGRHHDLALIVGIDQPDEVAEHERPAADEQWNRTIDLALILQTLDGIFSKVQMVPSAKVMTPDASALKVMVSPVTV